MDSSNYDLQPCEHTLTMSQVGAKKVVSKLLMKCSECELSSNLWLCLACGNLSCGRKYHDGTGGNGHALQHWQENKRHDISVKTGTISAEGTACKILLMILALYCYTCKTEILNPNIDKHLATLGIDIKKEKKTEKTVTEMVFFIIIIRI